MLLTKTIKIKITGMMIKYYTDLGYKFQKNEEIDIKIEDLSIGSKRFVEVKCDYCPTIKQIEYKAYLNNLKSGNNSNKYACSRKCSDEKIKATSIILYNTDNPAKSDEIKEKIKLGIMKHKNSINHDN